MFGSSAFWPMLVRRTAIVTISAPLACVAALLLTAFGCVVLFLFPEPLYRLLQLLAGPG